MSAICFFFLFYIYILHTYVGILTDQSSTVWYFFREEKGLKTYGCSSYILHTLFEYLTFLRLPISELVILFILDYHLSRYQRRRKRAKEKIYTFLPAVNLSLLLETRCVRRSKVYLLNMSPQILIILTGSTKYA